MLNLGEIKRKFLKYRLTSASLPHILLLIWFIFYIYINFLWLKIDHRPPRWDESVHFFLSEYSFQKLQECDIINALNTDLISNTKPGFVSFLNGVSYFFIGHSSKRAIFLTTSLSLLIIFISMYIIGKELYNSTAGLLSCIIFSSYHGTFMWSRYYNLDIPLAAAVSLTILFIVLIYKKGFASKKLSLMLGISLMLGMCVKHLYVIFVFFPMLYLSILAFIKKGSNLKETIKERRHFFISVFTGILFGIFYHILNFNIVREQLARCFAPASSAISWYKPPDIFTCLKSCSYFQLGTELENFFLLLFAAGFIVSCIRFSKVHIFLYLWFFGGLFFLLFIVYAKAPYYFSPLAPAFALISCGWLIYEFKIEKINKAIFVIKFILIIVICVLSVKYYLESSLGTSNILKIILNTPHVLREEKMDKNPFVDNPYWEEPYVDGNVVTLPYPHYWYMDEFIEETVRYLSFSERPLIIGTLVSGYEWMTAEYTRYKILQRGLDDKLIVVGTFGPSDEITGDMFFAEYDFLLFKTGEIAKKDLYVMFPDLCNGGQEFCDNALKNDGRLLKEKGFVLLKELPLPDGSEGSIWVNNRVLEGNL